MLMGQESVTDILIAELAQIESKLQLAAEMGDCPREVKTARGDYQVSYGRDDEDDAYALIEMSLPPIDSCWLVEIDDKTYGNLHGIRIYLEELRELVGQ